MTDFLLVVWVSLLIEFTRLQWMMGGGTRWQPGEKLKLLFAGYTGTRNTGSDAGHMDKLIADMCARFVHDSLVITRNPESQTVLGKLGISTELGTDTAWTFEPHPDAYGRKALRDAGWDEKTPVLILCPIHPFVWPVKASIAKYIARITTGAYKDSQYRTVYFHASGAENDRKFKHYIDGVVTSTRAFQQKHIFFTVRAAPERH